LRPGNPPPKCRVGRPLIQKGKWALCGFFRLFCTSRTCTPKPCSAPLRKVLVQSTSSNHAHGRGYHPDFITITRTFFRLYGDLSAAVITTQQVCFRGFSQPFTTVFLYRQNGIQVFLTDLRIFGLDHAAVVDASFLTRNTHW